MVRSDDDWPEWWSWPLDLDNPHLRKRMLDRGFNETDLRTMLADATGYRADDAIGRFIVATTHANGKWEVIV